MTRLLQAGIFALLLVAGLGAQPAKLPGARGPRLTNPNSPAARLFLAGPEERERVLSRLAPEQQERIRRNLTWFDALSQQDKDIVVQRTERFASLAPARRRLFNQQLRALNAMRQERRQAIRQALMRLQMMPDARRNAIIASEEFRNRFSPAELQIISDLSAVMLPGPLQMDSGPASK
jgi:hypothetical protein